MRLCLCILRQLGGGVSGRRHWKWRRKHILGAVRVVPLRVPRPRPLIEVFEPGPRHIAAVWAAPQPPNGGREPGHWLAQCPLCGATALGAGAWCLLAGPWQPGAAADIRWEDGCYAVGAADSAKESRGVESSDPRLARRHMGGYIGSPPWESKNRRRLGRCHRHGGEGHGETEARNRKKPVSEAGWPRERQHLAHDKEEWRALEGTFLTMVIKAKHPRPCRPTPESADTTFGRHLTCSRDPTHCTADPSDTIVTPAGTS